jgi:hypothetical protein
LGEAAFSRHSRFRIDLCCGFAQSPPPENASDALGRKVELNASDAGVAFLAEMSEYFTHHQSKGEEQTR